MEEAFFDTPLYTEFAQLEQFSRLPDESTIRRFRDRLEKHKSTSTMRVAKRTARWFTSLAASLTT